MTAGPQPTEPAGIPTFSECVVGYRAWRADDEGLLWPLYSRRDPWHPGTNTASCTRTWQTRLALRWLWGDRGQPIFGPATKHEAPDQDCACGLYSWRRPMQRWYEHPALCTPPRIVGAVASWGRIQVHADGFRARHACVVAFGYHGDAPPPQVEALAGRYGAELVPVARLEHAAQRHGSPLPDTAYPTRRAAG